MPYLGNIPASTFSSLSYQDLTGGTGTSFTLDHSVSSAQDIEVFVNNVRQEPGVAYTASGVALTMTGSIVATDDFYVVFQAKAFSTVSHPASNALQATSGTFSGAITTNGLTSEAANGTITSKASGSSFCSFTANTSAGNNAYVFFQQAGTEMSRITAYNGDTLAFSTGSGAAERMRIDNSGNVLVGKTSSGGTDVGHELNVAGTAYHTRDGVAALVLDRKTSDGNIAVFRKDGSTVGGIGSASGYPYLQSTNNVGLTMFTYVQPRNNGSAADNIVDLGSGSFRFDDVYATNGTIQTSDANEKQQIANLTDAEITAAKAISQLFKTFKWNSAVTEKGDAARTHAGVIAQDVQAAMTAAGLDASDYAFFISSTWYVDADGNEVEADAEGAIEKNRKGIRYPELLAFVGAATEQRLANIETRLAALEAN
jgi:hypothetical protein